MTADLTPAGGREGPTHDWTPLMRRVFDELSPLGSALGFEIVVCDSGHCVGRSSGPRLCRQVGSNQWIGEVLEMLASLTAGSLITTPGKEPDTLVAPYAATVHTVYNLRQTSSTWVEAEARWVRKGRTQAVIETTVRDAEGRELVRMLSQHAGIPNPLEFSLPERSGEEFLA